MPRIATPKIMAALKKAYENGSLSLSSVCPSCYMDHGACSYCGKHCGCSFNPTSSGDFCDFHR